MSQNTAQSNRAQMPQITAFVDAVRAEFGECKVSYASENGITKGAMWPEYKADPDWKITK